MGQIKVTKASIDGLYIIESTVHGDSRGYFMETYNENDMKENGIDITFGGTALVLPVTMITGEATIEVSVKEKDSEEPVVITDWKLDKVERKEEGKIDTFGAFFLSEEAKKHTWGPESDIIVTVKTGTEDIAYEFQYTTASVKTEWYDYITKAFSGHKNEWYDYLKIWEGHKNNWYDYFKVWENSVTFERVE